jgi:hypothetical protein
VQLAQLNDVTHEFRSDGDDLFPLGTHINFTTSLHAATAGSDVVKYHVAALASISAATATPSAAAAAAAAAAGMTMKTATSSTGATTTVVGGVISQHAANLTLWQNAAWTRAWCSLGGHALSVWETQAHAGKGAAAAMAVIPLGGHAGPLSVGKMARSECMRPHNFALKGA